MTVASVLVVCVGNISRSPVAERLLRARLPGRRIESAGLAAVVGAGVSPGMQALAGPAGLDVSGHVARQFTADLGAQFDLILVMEDAHRREIGRIAPQLLGKTLLMAQWLPDRQIADPQGRSSDIYQITFNLLVAAADSWAPRLNR